MNVLIQLMTDENIISALIVTLQLSTVSTFFLLIFSIPLAASFALTKSKINHFFEILFTLPIVLPPTVIGFYFLTIFSSASPAGKLWHHLFGIDFLFSFSALVAGSIIYSFPFVLQPIKNAFLKIPTTYFESADSLGASKWDQFTKIILPLSKEAILSSSILGFAHTMGEFGIIFMIGGNIPQKTQTSSILLFQYVETLETEKAYLLSFILIAMALITLVILKVINKMIARKSLY